MARLHSLLKKLYFLGIQAVAGAKAHSFSTFTARLKSGPDTKQEFFSSLHSRKPPATLEKTVPQRPKPVTLITCAARVNPCPSLGAALPYSYQAQALTRFSSPWVSRRLMGTRLKSCPNKKQNLDVSSPVGLKAMDD
jgi:hypothetical protein